MPEDEQTNLRSNNQHLVKELLRFPTFAELRDSMFFREHERVFRQLLNEPRIYRISNATPRLRSFLRVVEWNIERGTRLEGVIDVLNRHEVLSFADLLLINEIDEGMARSENTNVPAELSRALSAHAIVGFEYLELTKGAGEELKIATENTAALHGNAVLTRHEFFNPQVVRLPRCENNFESTERRLGGRIGILVDIETPARSFVIGNTHLDVVNTPRCRGKQMRAFLRAVDSRSRVGGQSIAAIVGGDLNTHTFARGTRFRAMKNTATILAGSPSKLSRRLSRPEGREPAIRLLTQFGFDVTGFNDNRPTSRSVVSNLDDPTRLPRPMKWWINRRIGPEGLLLQFRLDWLAARGLTALRAREVADERTGVMSVDPQTIQGLTHGGTQLSDHDPIVVDIALDDGR